MSLLVEGTFHTHSHTLSFWGDFMRVVICLKGSAVPKSKVTARLRTITGYIPVPLGERQCGAGI